MRRTPDSQRAASNAIVTTKPENASLPAIAPVTHQTAVTPAEMPRAHAHPQRRTRSERASSGDRHQTTATNIGANRYVSGPPSAIVLMQLNVLITNNVPIQADGARRITAGNTSIALAHASTMQSPQIQAVQAGTSPARPSPRSNPCPGRNPARARAANALLPACACIRYEYVLVSPCQ